MSHPIEEDLFPPFAGFPREGLQFLRRLKRNNNRPWFQGHKTEYEELVRFPMQCLVATLGRMLADEAPEFEFHPKRSVFRIYRDTRFSKNKTPYKTNVAASFSLRTAKGLTETPGLYVGVEPGQIYAGGGLYMPTSQQLKAIRQQMVAAPDEFLAIVNGRKFRKMFGGIEGEKLQRAPLGFAPDHPMIEHLKHKQFYVGVEMEESACFRAGFAEKIAAVYRECLPFTRWLARASG